MNRGIGAHVNSLIMMNTIMITVYFMTPYDFEIVD